MPILVNLGLRSTGRARRGPHHKAVCLRTPPTPAISRSNPQPDRCVQHSPSAHRVAELRGAKYLALSGHTQKFFSSSRKQTFIEMAELFDDLVSPTLPNRDRFLGLFYEPESRQLHPKTGVHLHVLRLEGGEFPLQAMYTELTNSTLGYVLSRQKYADFLSDPSRMTEVMDKVHDQFREPEEKSGEGGEVLLYAFLEAHLGAPKILSKMELKTDANDYVKGADGVHLLQVGADSYQLIFGESKMYGDAKTRKNSSINLALSAAFTSIQTLREEGFGFDTWLVQSEILKEIADDAKVDLLASILLPGGGASGLKKTIAFGIFIGFEMDVTDVVFSSLTDDAIETLIRKRSSDLLNASLPHLEKKIEEFGLGGYTFHLYAVPFMKRVVGGVEEGVQQVRVNLARTLGHRRGSK